MNSKIIGSLARRTEICTMETLYVYILVAVFLYIMTKPFMHKIQNLPPSPFPNLPFIGHLYLIKEPLHRTLAKISYRYGPVLLLQLGSRSVLVVSSPSTAEECLNKNDMVFANRPDLLAGKYIGYNYRSLVWSSYGDHWRNLRRISSMEVLSSNRLQSLHGIRVDEVKSMIRQMISSAKAQEAVEMRKLFFEMMLNVMMRMIAGKRYCGESVEDVEEAQRFREMVEESFRHGRASIGDFLPVLRWFGVGGEKSLKVLQEKRERFMQELVRDCRKGMEKSGGSKKKTFIEGLLELQALEPDYYNDELIRALMLAMLVGGSDTSGTTMEWAMSLLLNHPYVLKNAQAEIDNTIGNNRLLDESDVANLPYLRGIINETMRMYPAGPLLAPHESSEECAVGGYRVPKGTMLLVNVWTIHNDPNVWEEPKKFKPERFQGPEGTNNTYKLLPFGTGRRGCPGEGLAMRMIGLSLGTIIQCFDWERNSKELVDMTEGHGLAMPKAQPLMAKCTPRPSKLTLLSQI